MTTPKEDMARRLFAAGIDGSNDGGNNAAEQFGAWTRAMQRAITPPLETLSSILSWTRFEDPDARLLANEWLYFAHRVQDAACNRWVDDLTRYHLIMTQLREGIETWDEDGEAWHPPSPAGERDPDIRMAYSLLSPIVDDASAAAAARFLTKIERDTHIIQLKIEKAIRSGYMRDYRPAKSILASSDPDRVANSEVYEHLDFFGKRFIDLCQDNMAIPGQRHTQLVHAHAAEDNRGKTIHGEGGGGGKRRRNSGRSTDDDIDENAVT